MTELFLLHDVDDGMLDVIDGIADMAASRRMTSHFLVVRSHRHSHDCLRAERLRARAKIR